MKRKRLAISLLVLAVLSALTYGAVALPWGLAGSSWVGTQVIGDDAATGTTSTTWTNIPNTGLGFTVPAFRRQLLIIRFSGESACTGVTTPNVARCMVRILMNGQPVRSEAILDTAGDNSTQYESHYFQRAVTVGPTPSSAQYFVQAQFRRSATGVFNLKNYSLEVDRMIAR